MESSRDLLRKTISTSKLITAAGLPAPRDGGKRSAADMLSLDSVGFVDILQLWPELSAIPDQLHAQLAADCRYAGYIERQQADIDILRRDEGVAIPLFTDFAAVGGLSAEARDVLQKYQPETVGQANRLPGITPAAVVALLRYVRRQKSFAKEAVNS